MKNIMKFSAAMVMALAMTSCIEEVMPQHYYVSTDEVNNAPGAWESAVKACTSALTGELIYGPNSTNPLNFGLPSLFVQHDMEGQDMLPPRAGGWFGGWYLVSGYLSNNTSYGALLPWQFCYTWIKSCNNVLEMAGEAPTAEQASGVGIAYAVRALSYMELAQTYGVGAYARNPQALTVPIVTEATTSDELTDNPRATFAELYSFIMEDLNNAEKYLANYKRPDKTTPNVDAVYGLKARMYQLMEDWANAKSYAEKAMANYTILEPDEICDQTYGFNTANHAWIWTMSHASTDPCIMKNDGDTSWGAQMINEVGPSGCGYSSNYEGAKRIDKHLFQSIPYTDARKNLWLDFTLDEMTEAERNEALLTYTPGVKNVDVSTWYVTTYGGVPVKFRPHANNYADQYAAYLVDVPIMRVEEMKLIQAEAAGRMNEAEGIKLLTEFATQRDPQYVYGMHKVDGDTGCGMSDFMKELWWQRRVELWGEGFGMYDIKRLNAGIVRNYPGTNHYANYRWNTTEQPFWMNLLITNQEAAYNKALVDNDPIVRWTEDSPVYTKWN